MLPWMYPELYFGWHSQFSVNSLFQKKNKWEIEYIFSWKLPLEFLGFLFYSRKFRKNKASPQKLHKIALHPLELLRPKIKTPGNSIWFFFLITPENSILFLINPWKFHPHLPLCLIFFWNSTTAGVKVVYVLGNFCWYRICRSQVLNFQRLFYQQKLSFQAALGCFFGQNSPKCSQFSLTSDDMQDDASDMLRYLLKY